MLEKFKKKITQILLFASLIEVIFFFDFITIWATFVLLAGWLLIKSFVLTQRNMKTYPVTFFMFFGVALFHYALPIPLTLLEFKPVTFNMLQPIETFLHHGLFILVLTITHYFYRQLIQRKNPLRSILSKTIFYNKPSDSQIWLTAIIGALFSFYFYYIYGAWENYSEKNILITIGQSLTIFLWMPVIIPFYKVRHIESQLSQKYKVLIIIYSILIIVLSIVSNWRTILYSGIIIFLSMYIIGLLYGYYNYRKIFTTKKIIVIVISIFIISGPIMDLGIAMVVTRQTRYNTSSSEFLKSTLDVYNDKEFLKTFKQTMYKKDKLSFSINRWDEEYLDNYLFNRYCNLKISDNCIYYADKIGYANPKMQNILNDQVLSYIPSFISKSLDIKSNTRKEQYQSSITDNLYSIAIRDESVKGSAIIGSMPGVGLSIFGYWYLLVIIPIFLIIFTMFDSFAFIIENKVYFSYYFFTLLIIVFNFFNDRHVYNFELRWILRNYVESILMYLIFFYIIRNSIKLLSKK